MLMTFYPGLLRNILETIATAREQLSLPSNTAEFTFVGDLNFCEEHHIYRDKNVPVDISAYVKSEFPLSQRQLWFLVKLQDDKKPNARTISHHWQVSQRTAKRDIAYLAKHKIIRFCGAQKNGYYVLNSLIRQKRYS
jgi:predicted HTH transcriptional regulator